MPCYLKVFQEKSHLYFFRYYLSIYQLLFALTISVFSRLRKFVAQCPYAIRWFGGNSCTRLQRQLHLVLPFYFLSNCIPILFGQAIKTLIMPRLDSLHGSIVKLGLVPNVNRKYRCFTACLILFHSSDLLLMSFSFLIAKPTRALLFWCAVLWFML